MTSRTLSFFQAALIFGLMFVTPSCMRGCSSGQETMTPEQVVEAYLETALNMTDINQRQRLVQYTTGPLKAAIGSASDDILKAAYIDKKYKLERFSLVERRNRTPLAVEITFRLVFQDLTQPGADTKDAARVTTENTVSVVKERRMWLIRDVIGAKTSIDFFAPITIKPGEDTPAPQEGTQP
jgi:hypothetical protein